MFSIFGSAGSEVISNRQKADRTAFPRVEGTNLNGKAFILPDEIEGEIALLFIPFLQQQQLDVNTWVPASRQLAADYPRLAVYELPTIRSLPRISQKFIDGGMRAGIPDPIARATTITLYLDKRQFRKELGITREDSIHVMVINAAGEILWRTTGQATDARIAELRDFASEYFDKGNDPVVD